MRQNTRFFLVPLIMALTVLPAEAHMGAKGVVKERMDLMVSLGKTMKSLNAMARGKVPYDGRAVARAGQLIRDHSKKMPHLFPKGSMGAPSEARPEIWTNMGEFKKLSADLETEGLKLAEIGENGDVATLRKRFRQVGKVCSACHKSYRAKKRAK